VSRAVASVSAGRGRIAQVCTVQAAQLGVATVAIEIAKLHVGQTMAWAHVAGRRHRACKCDGGHGRQQRNSEGEC
jgi:hypothetical protein